MPNLSKSVLLASLLVLACTGDVAESAPLTGTPQPSGNVGGRALLSARMDEAGCKASAGRPRNGWIGIQTDSGILRFDCNGITGSKIRGAVTQYRKILQQRFAGQGASAYAGYMIRHYLGSVRYCDQTVTSMYMGDELVGKEVSWDESSCIWVDYFWDEWEPGSGNQGIPESYGGGGGPYYSPTDAQHRTPTIDTIAKKDHKCDGVGQDSLPNFACLVALTTLDSARIYDSLDVFLKPLLQIADSVQRMECDSIRHWMVELREYSENSSLPYIWAGRTDTVSAGKQPHDAQTNSNGNGTNNPPLPQLVHIDPKMLGANANGVSGKKLLLRAVMHETIHAWVGVYHDHSNLLSDAANGYPNDPFFRTLHAANACIL